MEQVRPSGGMRLLHQIMVRAEQMNDDVAVPWLLSALAEALGMELGLVGRVADREIVAEHAHPSDVVRPGQRFALDGSACSQTLADGRLTTSLDEADLQHGGRPVRTGDADPSLGGEGRSAGPLCRSRGRRFRVLYQAECAVLVFP